MPYAYPDSTILYEYETVNRIYAHRYYRSHGVKYMITHLLVLSTTIAVTDQPKIRYNVLILKLDPGKVSRKTS